MWYEVLLDQSANRTVVVRVEAASMKEAERIALAMDRDTLGWSFSEDSDSEVEVLDAWEAENVV